MHIIIENAITQANKVLLVTFGEPRVGDPLFAQRLDGMVPLQHFTYRVVHKSDFVTSIPPAELMKSKPFRHHMTEVIMLTFAFIFTRLQNAQKVKPKAM